MNIVLSVVLGIRYGLIGILLATIMFYVTSFIVGQNYITRLTLYYKTPIIYLFGFILIGIPLFIKTKKIKQPKNISNN